MKLLIVTQVVDTEHSVLGFFHRWIEEFAKHCETVQVICLQAGKHSLPANVHVHSLGKEDRVGRLVYLWRFYKYSWQLRHEYDSVFVHMVPLYVILGAPIWKFLRKKIGLWYVHGTVDWKLRAANFLVHKIFTAVSEGFNLKTKKVVYTGHGIDVGHFIPITGVKKDIDLVTVGRIAPVKNVEALVDMLAIVRAEQDRSLTIIGSFSDSSYETVLRKYISSKKMDDYVRFLGPVTQVELPSTLNRARVFVTAAQNGSLDKVVLEAMACGLPVVSMAPGTLSLPLGEAQVKTTQQMAAEISKEISAAPSNHRSYIEKQHGLATLITKLISAYGT